MRRNKIILTLACMAMVVSIAACGNTSKKGNTEISSDTSISKEDTKNENIQIPNPWVDCKNMKEAEKIAGFSYEIPEKIDDYTDISIQVLDEDMIQVVYQKDEESITLRKGRGSDDVSGNYSEYDESKEITVGDYQVTEKGNDGNVMLATWTSGDYSYSVDTSGMSAEAINEIIQQVK